MALINCPECKKEVSSIAVSCPHCGYPIKEIVEEEQQKRNKNEEEQRRKKQEETGFFERKSNELKNNVPVEERQKRLEEVVISEERAIRRNKVYIVINVIVSLVLFGLTVWCFCVKAMFGGVLFGFLTVSITLCIPVFTGAIKESKHMIVAANKGWDNYISFKEYKTEQFRMKLEESRKEQERQNAINHPKCPHCGGNNTSRITTTGRMVSTAALGLASSTIGKQYQCYDCKHKW